MEISVQNFTNGDASNDQTAVVSVPAVPSSPAPAVVEDKFLVSGIINPKKVYTRVIHSHILHCAFDLLVLKLKFCICCS